MSRILQTGTLYILELEDPAGGDVPPFYKIGFTTDSVAKRIRQLQTGNPYRIVEESSYEFEAAELIEKHLHRVFIANRRILEWFAFDDDELEAVKAEAVGFAEELAGLVVVVRDSDLVPNTDEMLEASGEALALHAEAVELESTSLQIGLRKSILRFVLEQQTGASKGIDGITNVKVTNPGPSFKLRLFKDAHLELYQEFQTLPSFKSSFRVLGKQTVAAHPELNQEKKDAAEAVETIAVEDIMEQRMERDDMVVTTHADYLDILSREGEVSRDLLLVKMRLKALCGEAKGIEGVCTYARSEQMNFDKEAFIVEHPDLYAEFTTQNEPQRRFEVKRARDYS